MRGRRSRLSGRRYVSCTRPSASRPAGELQAVIRSPLSMQAKSYLRRYCCPIFAADHEKRLGELVATSVPMRIADRQFLITAGHVLDVSRSPLFEIPLDSAKLYHLPTDSAAIRLPIATKHALERLFP